MAIHQPISVPTDKELNYFLAVFTDRDEDIYWNCAAWRYKGEFTDIWAPLSDANQLEKVRTVCRERTPEPIRYLEGWDLVAKFWAQVQTKDEQKQWKTVVVDGYDCPKRAFVVAVYQLVSQGIRIQT